MSQLKFQQTLYTYKQNIRISMIYTIVAREKLVLTDYTSFGGNFSQVALEVLERTNMAKIFGQYVTANYTFYTFVKEAFVFLVMVESAYETRIAVNYLKKIQETFFARYNSALRNKAAAHSLSDFMPILQQWMNKYSNKAEVDKLSRLKKQLSEIQEQALRNMDKIIQRGEKIEILVKKSQSLAKISTDINDLSTKVKDKLWWKNKKVMVGIALVLVVVVTIIVVIVATR